MRNGYKRIFQTNPHLLKDMLSDYKHGMTCSALGEKYSVDHTSIIHWVKKTGVWKPQVHITKPTPAQASAQALPRIKRPPRNTETVQANIRLLTSCFVRGMSRKAAAKHTMISLGAIQYYFKKFPAFKILYIENVHPERIRVKNYSHYLKEYNEKMKPIREAKMAKAIQEMKERQSIMHREAKGQWNKWMGEPQRRVRLSKIEEEYEE